MWAKAEVPTPPETLDALAFVPPRRNRGSGSPSLKIGCKELIPGGITQTLEQQIPPNAPAVGEQLG